MPAACLYKPQLPGNHYQMMLRSLAKQAARPVLQRATGGRLVWRGPTERRRVALTFDDGPHALTTDLLELLAHHGVPATFFVMGAWVEERPQVVVEYLRGGHQLAGHGYYHTRFTTLSPRELRAELARMSDAIGPMRHGHWVRPPHGTIGAVDVSTMLATGYVVALWSLDSLDHAGASPDKIAERCRPDAVRPGEVILMHEGEAATLEALPTIIARLQADGYELVTMADLITP